MKPFYTAKDLIRLLGFSKNTIYKYLEDGKIKSTRVGKRGGFRVPAAEVKRLLQLKGENLEGKDLNGEDKKSEKDEGHVSVEEAVESGRVKYEGGSVLEKLRLRTTESDDVKRSPNLFDWFLGLIAIGVGFSMFLFPGYFYHQQFSALLPYIAGLRFLLLVSGFGFLISDLTSPKKHTLHSMLHLVLTGEFGLLAGLFILGGVARGVVLYASIALVLVVTAAVRKVLPIYRFIWLVFLVSGVSALVAGIFPDSYQVEASNGLS